MTSHDQYAYISRLVKSAGDYLGVLIGKDGLGDAFHGALADVYPDVAAAFTSANAVNDALAKFGVNDNVDEVFAEPEGTDAKEESTGPNATINRAVLIAQMHVADASQAAADARHQ